MESIPEGMRNTDAKLFAAVREGDVKHIEEILTQPKRGFLSAAFSSSYSNSASNAENVFGRTPLHYACRYGHIEAVKALIETGEVSLVAANKNGWTCLHDACFMDRGAVVEYVLHALLERATNETSDDMMDDVHELLDMPLAVTIHNSTCLHIAAKNNKLSALAALLTFAKKHFHEGEGGFGWAKKRFIDMTNDRGQTALYVACDTGFEDGALTLLAAGASPKKRNNNGTLPIHIAALNNLSNFVKMIITRNLLTDEDKYGNTMVHYASHGNSLEVLDLLFQMFGSAVVKLMSKRNRRGKKAIELADVKTQVIIKEKMSQL